MNRWASWIEGALTPRPDEVARVVDPLPSPLRDELSRATAPTDAEINHLLMNRHAWAARQRKARMSWGAAVSAGVLVAAAGLFFVSAQVRGDGYGPVDLQIGQVLALTAPMQLDLGPSIDVVGEATLRVDQADAGGTVVALLDGRANFEVDPTGAYRSLKVRAHEVEVEVAGTNFDVAVDDGAVWVEVARGKVIVRHQGEERFLVAGERWTDQVLVVARPVERAVIGSPGEAPAAPEAVIASTSAPVRRAPVAVVSSPVVAAPAPSVVAPEPANVLEWRKLEKRRASMGPDDLIKEYRAFLETYGDSAIAPTVRLHRLRLLAEREPSNRTLGEIDAWLAENPRDTQRSELLWLGADMAREKLGSCERALPAYRELAEMLADQHPDAARAAAYRGICALQVGAEDEDEAWLSLQRANFLEVQPAELRKQVLAELAELTELNRKPRKR